MSMMLKTQLPAEATGQARPHVSRTEDHEIRPSAILVGLCAGIGGILTPGVCEYWAGSRDLLEELTVTAPVVFAVAIVVLAFRARFARTPSQLLFLSAAVLGICYAFCETAVHLGGFLFRRMVMGTTEAVLASTHRLDPSFISMVGAHYSAHGVWAMGLAAGIGVPVGLIWAACCSQNSHKAGGFNE